MKSYFPSIIYLIPRHVTTFLGYQKCWLTQCPETYLQSLLTTLILKKNHLPQSKTWKHQSLNLFHISIVLNGLSRTSPKLSSPIIKTLYYRTHSCVQHCPTSFTLIFFFAEVSMNSQLKCRARFIPWSLPTTLSSSRSLLFPTRIMGTCQTVHKTMVTNIHSFK